MAEVVPFARGGYRFIKGVFQYSAGVAASPGFRIRRVRFRELAPLLEGFRRIEAYLNERHRPLESFCACELRSPAPFTEAGFRSFNEQYVGGLQGWNIIESGINPVARSNVCPLVDPPAEPCVYAFSYTEPTAASNASFIIAGGAEAPEGRSNYRDHIVRLGDLSAAGIHAKALWVLDEMERRLGAFGFGWRDTTAVQIYTVHDFHSAVVSEIARRGAASGGLTWHVCRPPVIDLEYEMDCRGVFDEAVLA